MVSRFLKTRQAYQFVQTGHFLYGSCSFLQNRSFFCRKPGRRRPPFPPHLRRRPFFPAEHPAKDGRTPEPALDGNFRNISVGGFRQKLRFFQLHFPDRTVGSDTPPLAEQTDHMILGVAERPGRIGDSHLLRSSAPPDSPSSRSSSRKRRIAGTGLGIIFRSMVEDFFICHGRLPYGVSQRPSAGCREQGLP